METLKFTLGKEIRTEIVTQIKAFMSENKLKGGEPMILDTKMGGWEKISIATSTYILRDSVVVSLASSHDTSGPRPSQLE